MEKDCTPAHSVLINRIKMAATANQQEVTGNTRWGLTKLNFTKLNSLKCCVLHYTPRLASAGCHIALPPTPAAELLPRQVTGKSSGIGWTSPLHPPSEPVRHCFGKPSLSFPWTIRVVLPVCPSAEPLLLP